MCLWTGIGVYRLFARTFPSDNFGLAAGAGEKLPRPAQERNKGGYCVQIVAEKRFSTVVMGLQIA